MPTELCNVLIDAGERVSCLWGRKARYWRRCFHLRGWVWLRAFVGCLRRRRAFTTRVSGTAARGWRKRRTDGSFLRLRAHTTSRGRKR